MLAPREGIVTFSVAYGVFVVLAVRFIRRSSGRGYLGRLGTGRPLMRYRTPCRCGNLLQVARFPLAVVITGRCRIDRSWIGRGSDRAHAAVLPRPPGCRDPHVRQRCPQRRRDARSRSTQRQGCISLDGCARLFCDRSSSGCRTATPWYRYAETVSLFVLLLVCLVPQLTQRPSGTPSPERFSWPVSGHINCGTYRRSDDCLAPAPPMVSRKPWMGLGGSACFTGVAPPRRSKALRAKAVGYRRSRRRARGACGDDRTLGSARSWCNPCPGRGCFPRSPGNTPVPYDDA